MIRGFVITNHRGQRVELDLFHPEKTGLLISKVDGLGPPSAPVNMTEYASLDGGFPNSSRMSYRNIVFYLLPLDENDTIETVRQNCYGIFPIKKVVEVEIYTDNRNVVTSGVVESIEPTIFSNKQTIQVSIVCGDPYLYSLDEIERTTFNGVEDLFEFPFSNESLTERLINFGEIKDGYSSTIFYQGDIETGVQIELWAIGDVSNITINRPDVDEFFKIDTDILKELTGTGFTTGDRIVISTVKRRKGVFLDRNGIRKNIVSCVGRGSTWFQLATGINPFNYVAEKGADKVEINMQNQVVYEGI